MRNNESSRPRRRIAHPKQNHECARSRERESGGQYCWTIDPGVRTDRRSGGHGQREGSIATEAQ